MAKNNFLINKKLKKKSSEDYSGEEYDIDSYDTLNLKGDKYLLYAKGAPEIDGQRTRSYMLSDNSYYSWYYIYELIRSNNEPMDIEDIIDDIKKNCRKIIGFKDFKYNNYGLDKKVIYMINSFREDGELPLFTNKNNKIGILPLSNIIEK